MKLIEKIKEQIEEGRQRIRVKEEISEPYYAEVRMTIIKGQQISWETSTTDLSLAIQPLTSGAAGMSWALGRIDNAHGFLHEHISGGLVGSLGDISVSRALTDFCSKYHI